MLSPRAEKEDKGCRRLRALLVPAASVPGTTTYQAASVLTSIARWKARLLEAFYVRASLAGIEPVGFRTKSDLRNHQAIVQPRLYDCLMVTQITLID